MSDPRVYPPQSFEKAMVFIDGSNLFNRLRDARLRLRQPLYVLANGACQGRKLLRVCLYTTHEKLEKAREEHGRHAFDDCRLIFGDSIQGGGTVREKGVDAQLVADLVYHAASKNIDFAVLFSNDSDFVFAMKRVEDFGCRTALVSLCVEAPERLRSACDHYEFHSKEELAASVFFEEI